MKLVLYRAGALTPLENIPAPNQWFSEASVEYMHKFHSPRVSSVFASRTKEEAEQWVDWRHDMCFDSADIWRITITDLSSPIFAHYCDRYENAGFARSMPDYAVEGEFERNVKEYWDTAVDVRVFPIPVEGEAYREVLIPYRIAVEAEWELVEKRPAPEWQDEETYFDSYDLSSFS